MTFVTERDRRQTAGNRLKRLLEQQEDPDDEFYGTAYGGFLDVRSCLFFYSYYYNLIFLGRRR